MTFPDSYDVYRPTVRSGMHTEAVSGFDAASTKPIPRGIPLSRGLVALVDEEDYGRLTAMGKWYAHPNGKTVYARRVGDGLMHTVITGWPMVDHIDGNGLNNQRSNLRPTDHSSNLANSRIRSDNKSGYKGVHLHVPAPRWVAGIRARGKSKTLGRFQSREEAAAAYDIAARELFGEFANPNFPTAEDGPLPQDAHTWACAGFEALLNGDHAAAKRCLARLTSAQLDSVSAGAAVFIAFAGGVPDVLPQRINTPCAVCGRAGCAERFHPAWLDGAPA